MNENLNNNVVLTSTFKIPDILNKKLDEKVVGDGYGMRGKSRWIKEAIEALFTYPDCSELVSLSDDLEQASKAVSIRLSRNMLLDIEKMVITVRKEHPELEGIKSRIVRTAIMQRFIRGF